MAYRLRRHIRNHRAYWAVVKLRNTNTWTTTTQKVSIINN